MEARGRKVSIYPSSKGLRESPTQVDRLTDAAKPVRGAEFLLQDKLLTWTAVLTFYLYDFSFANQSLAVRNILIYKIIII